MFNKEGLTFRVSKGEYRVGWGAIRDYTGLRENREPAGKEHGKLNKHRDSVGLRRMDIKKLLRDPNCLTPLGVVVF